jgi:cellobiose epimerase
MTVDAAAIAGLRREVEREWRDNIAPFWLRHAIDDEFGGFRGWIAGDLSVDERADKGVILNARILWTFARASRLFKDSAFRTLADRAYDYFVAHFVDREHGGVYWAVDHLGRPADTKKRSYAQAFALYGLVEYHAATGGRLALDRAFDLFGVLETRCRDAKLDGYFETFERDWTLAGDQRLSDVDQDDCKSMNAHLHVLEAYTSLAATTRDARVLERLSVVLNLFLDRVLDVPGARLRMFFDEAWNATSEVDSFGHDIEASWLLVEAAEVVGDDAVTRRVRSVALDVASAVLARAVDEDGGLLYEAKRGVVVNDEKHWWVQAEGVVGFLNAFHLSGDDRFFASALGVWRFIRERIVDHELGEWHWKLSRSGVPSATMPKVSQWKCPYHNGRMCFEIARRLGEIGEGSGDGSSRV